MSRFQGGFTSGDVNCQKLTENCDTLTVELRLAQCSHGLPTPTGWS